MSRSRVSLKKVVLEATCGCSTIFGQTVSSDVFGNESLVSLKNNTPTENISLHFFNSSLFAAILEDTITQIRMFSECNNELRILKTISDLVHLLANKYNVEQPAVKDELDGIDRKALSKQKYKLDKLSNDRKYLYESLLRTYLDLALNQSFLSLNESIELVVNQGIHRAYVLEDEAKNRVASRELAKQLRVQRNHIKSVNYDTGLMIEDLKTQVEDTGVAAEIRSRYITNCQVARTEQHQRTIENTESSPMANIEYYKTRTDNEQRVHAEVELMNNIAINDKIHVVESWMNKYDKDMEKIDLKIQIKKNDHTNQLEYRMQLEDTFAKHDQLMKNWEHFKEEREKARQYVEKMTNAATAVQAWWRGLLVRRQLGPYKPAKKPPKGKKK